jgi:hypothetical protein
MVRAIEDDRDSQNAAAGAANALKEAIMKIRKVENGLALVGALFILLAVAGRMVGCAGPMAALRV